MSDNFELYAKAFDEWQRQYVEEPDSFRNTYSGVKEYLEGVAHNEEITSYGRGQSAFFIEIIKQISG